jgi:hypothetical protein
VLNLGDIAVNKTDIRSAFLKLIFLSSCDYDGDKQDTFSTQNLSHKIERIANHTLL